MKKKVAVVLIAALFCAASYLVYSYFIKEKELPGLQATGTIEATQVELRAKLSGTLRDFKISEGELVKKDQLVAVINRNDLIAQKERDTLGVLEAQAQLDDLTSGAREQEIKEAEIAVDTAQTNCDQAGRDYERVKALYDQKVIPESEMEKSETAYKQAKNQLDAAKNRLSLLLSGNRPDKIKTARAELERSKAILKASGALLEDTKIITPINGTVLSKNVENGEMVQTGASIATIADLDNLWIKVYIPTDDLPKIKLGQQVIFTVSGGSVKYTGQIEEIASQGEFTPKTIQTKKERTNIVYAVKIRIKNENGVLKPGMPADVTIP